MAQLQQATPHVKKNILLIRGLLSFTLLCFAYFFTAAHPEAKNTALLYTLFLAATFLPFYFFKSDRFEAVRFQYTVFSMDFALLLVGLYLFDHMETNLIITIFLTFFISALSQSVGRSVVVAVAVIGIYLYLTYYNNEIFNYGDPFLLLSCLLLFVVAIHSGYMAYRTVQEETELLTLARKATLLSEKVREGDEAALNYAATLKSVLDTFPIGAIAVSTEGNTLFVNTKAGKILDQNPKTLTGIDLFRKNSPLGPAGERMGRSLKDRQELKKEYVDFDWKGGKRRLRLDSSSGSGPTGKVWGTLFLLQESTPPKQENAKNG